MLRQRWINGLTDVVMGAFWMTSVLVMILACTGTDYYYLNFYGN